MADLVGILSDPATHAAGGGISVSGVLWWLFRGTNKKVDGLEGKLENYELSCEQCRTQNSKDFASQNDLNIIRVDQKSMLEHIDRRFDNLTAIIVGKLSK